MSVDFEVCNSCGETFPDCGYKLSCAECGKYWCSEECAYEDGVIRGSGEYSDGSFDVVSCKYCRKEDFSDYVILDKALELLGKTRQEIVDIINKGE